MGKAPTSRLVGVRIAVVEWRSLGSLRHGMYKGREDKKGSQCLENINIPDACPESNQDLDKVPGSLKEFLKNQKVNFLEWPGVWKDRSLAVEMDRLYDRLQVQINDEFEVMAERMKKIFLVLLWKIYEVKCLTEKLKST